MVEDQLNGDYETVRPRGIPKPGDIPLTKRAGLLYATALFIDVRQSSDITNVFRRQTAAKMMKSFFAGSVRLIRKNGGEVTSFNGDGMLAIFVGESQVDDAAHAAGEVEGFVLKVLQPKFNAFFERNSKARRLDFSIGAGIDQGNIYAVGIGIRGTNDIAWVGRCTNTAAKLSNVLHSPDNIGITGSAYNSLSDELKLTRRYKLPRWSEPINAEFGGVDRSYRTSHWYYKPAGST